MVDSSARVLVVACRPKSRMSFRDVSTASCDLLTRTVYSNNVVVEGILRNEFVCLFIRLFKVGISTDITVFLKI